MVIIAAVVVVLVSVLIVLATKIVRQYERAVVFRLGKIVGGAREPGLVLIIPLIERVQLVDMRIVTMPIQSQ